MLLYCCEENISKLFYLLFSSPFELGSGNPGGSLARLRELAQLTLGYIGESLVRLWELTQTTPVYKKITRVHIINAIVIHVTSFFL